MGKERELCMSCGSRPSVSGGPVPLCASCQKKADGNSRGVKFQKTQQDQN